MNFDDKICDDNDVTVTGAGIRKLGPLGDLILVLHHLNGDCDSRTLFIYTVLKKFNYDVVILNSDLYAHSIIGLNIPSSGRYKYYNGKRYYTWETTAKGYELGVLPADFSNIDYWYIALT